MVMTKQQFKNLKVGDLVVLNGQCRTNVGIKCVVNRVMHDCNRIWVTPMDGERGFEGDWSCGPDMNEIAYTSATIIS